MSDKAVKLIFSKLDECRLQKQPKNREREREREDSQSSSVSYEYPTVLERPPPKKRKSIRGVIAIFVPLVASLSSDRIA